MDAAALIALPLQRLRDDFGVTTVTASEIEFYLHGSAHSAALPDFWAEVAQNAATAGITLFNTAKEDGPEQHEASLAPYADPAKTARDTEMLKTIITDAATRQNWRADFAPKPFAGQPGSGLHIHVHLENAAGKNIFYKDDATIAPSLAHSLGGLLAWLPDCLPVFAPNADSYARFTQKSNSPTTISWGANNRTVALRLPQSDRDKKRIEHRVSGVDADAAKVIALMLAAMHYGLSKRCDPGPQIFGDASLPQYALPRFPASQEEALARFQNSKLITQYFSPADF